MAGLVSFDDNKRTFILEVNGIQREIAYPEDVRTFREFKDAGAYVKGFASLFRPAPAAPKAKHPPQHEWL